MATILDTIGAFLFGALLILTAARLNMYVQNTQQQSVFDLKAQQMSVQMGQILESDLYRIGNGMKTTATMFKTASADTIAFYGDVDDNGVVDTVSYWSTAKTAPVNPHHRLVYRKVNSGNALRMDVGVSRLKLSYFDSKGVSTSTLTSIFAVKVVMDVESDVRNSTAGGQDTVYNSLRWQQYIVPARLHR